MSVRRLALTLASSLRPRLLLVPLALPVLVGAACSRSLERPSEAVSAGTTLDALAARHPAAARWTARARGAAGAELRTGALLARADARGLELRRADDPRSIRVRREGRAWSEGGTLVQAGLDATAVTFVDAGGIEDLVETSGDVDYQLELPAGHTLRAACAADTTSASGSRHAACNVAEVRDAAGRPFLRVSAPIAWDARGAAREPRIEVIGRDRLRVVVDAEAPRPLLVDPRWTTPSLPALARRGHAATPLGDGRILLTGGGSAVTELYDPQTGEFALGPVLAASRFFHTATLLPDGRVLVAGGFTASLAGPALATTDVIDPTRGTVTPGPTLAGARARHTATPLTNGKVLLAGGYDGTATLGSTEIFEPSTATLSAGVTLRAPRAQHTATRLANGKIVLVGGTSDGSFSSEILGVGAGATVVGPTLLGVRREHATVTLPDGRLLVLGGLDSLGSLSSTELCPAAAGPCVAGPTLGQVRVDPHVALLPSDVAAVTGGVAYGTDSSMAVRTTELLTATSRSTLAVDAAVAHLDHTATPLPSGSVFVFGGDEPTADQLVADREGHVAAPTPFPRNGGAAVALLTGEVLVAGGNASASTSATTTAALYQTSPAGWALTGALAQARSGARALTLDDGRVLVVGSDAGPGASTAELYDRAAGTFTLVAAPMAGPRARPSLTRLPSGKILVAGGGTSSAELFDPKSATFTKTGSLGRARGDHAAVLLRDGRVLFAGGVDSDVAEVYRPDGTFAPLAAPMGRRPDCRGALLPSGKVLLTGGASRQGETFDPSTNTFTPTAIATEAHRAGTLSVLPTGGVLVVGGRLDDPFTGVSTAEVFEQSAGAGAGGFVPVPSLLNARIGASSTLLDDGRVLQAGGTSCDLCPNLPTSAELFSERPATAARAVIAAAPAKATVGTAIDLTGTGFVASPEPTDGTTGGAALTPPFGVFVPLAGDAVLFGRTVSWSATSLRWEVPSSARLGPGRLFVLVRGIPSKSVWLTLEAAPQASACSADAACTSGFCVDGVCCDRACGGACEACSAARKGSGADGVCGAIPPEKDPTDACVLGLGAKCTTAAQCTTGQCVDGVCCNAACDGQCEACDVEGSFGTCVPTIGAPHGTRAACAAAAGSDACAAKLCDGKARARCGGFVGASVSCRAASCAAGEATLPARCDGTGACPSPITKPCTPNACDGDACRTDACTSDAQCAPDHRCAIASGASRGDCVVRTDAFCADDRTSVGRDGERKACDPYRCTPTGCAVSCASSDECLGGFVCDTTAKSCVPGATSGASSSGGCATSSSSTSSTGSMTARGAAAGLLVFALAALGRRRRRA
jgi:hypothetical protein